MILQAFSRMLRDIGYEVTLVRGMNEAWQTWLGSEQRFAVVITDVRLGADRGTELVRKVLADRVNTHHLAGRVVFEPTIRIDDRQQQQRRAFATQPPDQAEM